MKMVQCSGIPSVCWGLGNISKNRNSNSRNFNEVEALGRYNSVLPVDKKYSNWEKSIGMVDVQVFENVFNSFSKSNNPFLK